MAGSAGRGGGVITAAVLGGEGVRLGWGPVKMPQAAPPPPGPPPPLAYSGSPGTYRALSSASHFPFSLPRQMFFSASLIPVAGL